MKNSPHHQKHLQKKALRAARQIHLAPEAPSKPEKINLTNLNTENCKKVLDVYKKHLERARFMKKTGHHHSKRTTPGEVESIEHKSMHLRNTKRISIHAQSAYKEKTRSVAKKIMHQASYKKAA